MTRNGFARHRLLFAGAGTLMVLLAALLGYYRWANDVPPFSPPPAAVGGPNAYDELTRLAAALHPAPGATSAQARGFDPAAPLPDVRRGIHANAATLDEALLVVRRPYFEPPQYGFDARFPHYAGLRNLARAFAGASRVAAADGQFDVAAEESLAAIEMGSRVPRGAPLIGGLVGIAIQAIGYSSLEPLLPRLSASGTERALAAVRRCRREAPTFAETLRWEYEYSRWGLIKEFNRMEGMTPLDAARAWSQMFAIPDVDGEAKPSPSWLGLRMAFTPKRAALASFDRFYSELITAAGKPWGEWRPPTLPNDPINQLLVPVVDTARAKWAQRDAQLAALETWLLARRYEQRHGSPAASAAVLIAATGPLPIDPFTGRPCVYRPAGNSFVAYSVGEDGRDDSGTPLSLRNWNRDVPGDLVVGRMYPPRKPAAARP